MSESAVKWLVNFRKTPKFLQLIGGQVQLAKKKCLSIKLITAREREFEMANNKKYKKIEIKSREKFASNFQSESARKKVLNKSGLHGKQNRSTKKQGDKGICNTYNYIKFKNIKVMNAIIIFLSLCTKAINRILFEYLVVCSAII